VRDGLKGDGEIKLKAVTIIACGKEILPKFRPGASADKTLRSLHTLGVDIVACGISMKKAGVDSKDLHPFLRIVPNGLTELIRLKGSGYLGVEL